MAAIVDHVQLVDPKGVRQEVEDLTLTSMLEKKFGMTDTNSWKMTWKRPYLQKYSLIRVLLRRRSGSST